MIRHGGRPRDLDSELVVGGNKSLCDMIWLILGFILVVIIITVIINKERIMNLYDDIRKRSKYKKD